MYYYLLFVSLLSIFNFQYGKLLLQTVADCVSIVLQLRIAGHVAVVSLLVRE